MKIFFALSLFATMMLIATESYSQIAKHIIVIRTDDIGVNYNIDHTIPTPNIDRMASQGLTITTNYALIACAPDRVMFETMNYNQYIGISKIQLELGYLIQEYPPKLNQYQNTFKMLDIALALLENGTLAIKLISYHQKEGTMNLSIFQEAVGNMIHQRHFTVMVINLLHMKD